MGCGNSKNKVHVVSQNGSPTTDQTNQDNVKEDKNSSREIVDNRGGSATSKFSSRSGDSGFADNEYARVMTEKSDRSRIKAVEEGFKSAELDLIINGKQCPRRVSAKDKDRLEEQRVLAALREEGLIQRPMSRAAFGVSFDIVANDADVFGERRPPARLAKLELRKKKKKKVLTEEQIREKLQRAEDRRKERENQRLERIQSVTCKSDVQNALDSFAEMQRSKDVQERSKQDLVEENRIKKLEEMKRKLRQKEEHAAAVRRRKQLAPMPLASEDEPQFMSKRYTEDTPVAAVSQSIDLSEQ